MTALVPTPVAVERSGATTRQVDYWTRNGIVTPAVEACGSGSRRAWSDEDITALIAIAKVANALSAEMLADLFRQVGEAARDTRYDDVWLDLGDGVSLVVDRSAVAVAS